MVRLQIKIIAIGGALSSVLFADPGQESTVYLYQIGQKGQYCVSVNGDEKGCISGADDSGKVMNVMDMLKDHKVAFKNLSDAPHDMVFTGKNAEALSPQMPQEKDVSKQMKMVDPDKQEITCSFHGLQLGVGYRVLDPAEEQDAGHKSLAGSQEAAMAMGMGAMGGGGFSNPRASLGSLMTTGLSDVSDFMMRFGPRSEASRLLDSRPELQGAYPKEAAQLKSGNTINFNGMTLERTGLNFQAKNQGASSGRALASIPGSSSSGSTSGNGASESMSVNASNGLNGNSSGSGNSQGQRLAVGGRILREDEYSYIPESNQMIFLIGGGHAGSGEQLAIESVNNVGGKAQYGTLAGQVFGNSKGEKGRDKLGSALLSSATDKKDSSSSVPLRAALLVSALGLLGASKLIGSKKT